VTDSIQNTASDTQEPPATEVENVNIPTLVKMGNEEWPEWLVKYIGDLDNMQGPEGFKEVVSKLARLELVLGFPSGQASNQLLYRCISNS